MKSRNTSTLNPKHKRLHAFKMKQAPYNQSLFAMAGMENVLVHLARLLVGTEHQTRVTVFMRETL